MPSRSLFPSPRARRGLAALLALAIACGTTLAAEPPTSAPSGAVVALGKKLFFDPRLSHDGKISCSSCHQPAHAFTDGRVVSVGVGDQTGTRNTPSLQGLFDGEPLFWDGRRDKLQVAVLDPIGNPVEMAQPDLPALAHRLSASPDYANPIAQAFPGTRQMSPGQMGEALAAFLRTLPKQQSAYDLYVAGRPGALTNDAMNGLRLFQGKAACSGCHDLGGGRFTDAGYHHSGVGLDTVAPHLGQLTRDAERRNLQGGALGNAIAQQSDLSSLGRFLVSHRASDVGAFRTPSLRNVAMTAPYMHDGSVKTLEAAVDTEVYYRGLSTGKPIALTARERADLLVFLRSLTESAPR